MSQKVCARCHVLKDCTEFDFKNRAKEIRQAACKSCAREYSREHYHRNRDKALEKAKHHNDKYKAQKREITARLKNRPCTDCGLSFPWYCMEFDHRVPETKLGDIANMKNDKAVSVPAFEAELAKCDVVCANCHRARTFHRHNHRDRKTA